MVKFLDNNSGFNAWNSNREASKPKSKLGSFFWWLIIFLGSLWLINNWNKPKDVPQPTESDTASITSCSADIPLRKISGTDDKITVDVRGLCLDNFALTDYAATTDNTDRVTLFGGMNEFVEIGLQATGTTAPDSKTVWTESDDKMIWRAPNGVVFTREVSVDGYIVTVTDTVENKTKNDITLAPYVHMVRDGKIKSDTSSQGAIANANSHIDYVDWSKLDKKPYEYTTTNGFVGFSDQYWQTVADIKSPDQTMRVKSFAGKYVADSTAAVQVIKPGDSWVFTTSVFAGPREQKILDVAETTIPGIAKSIDYGWFWFFARPMLWALNILYSFVMNYGVAIILLTILLRLLMWPLTRKSYKSSMAMQQMQPEMKRIQKLYANDKARMQMEMMNLYRTHKTSPMSGCLPMLIQIPIFFALYKALLISVNMRNAHFLWISDLSVYDPYFILPILMGVTMWLQQYLQSGGAKKDTDTSDPIAKTGRMMKWMPVLFTVMFAILPAGLILYWTISNIFGIVQTYIIKKQLNKN